MLMSFLVKDLYKKYSVTRQDISPFEDGDATSPKVYRTNKTVPLIMSYDLL